MEELYNYDINDKDIKNMLEINNDIFNLTNEEIKEKITILESINCSNDTIRHILTTNVFYLTNNSNDVINLIKLFNEFSIDINEMLNINPFILNNNIYDIKEYIDKCKTKGLNNEFIVDNLINNPYIINEDI